MKPIAAKNTRFFSPITIPSGGDRHDVCLWEESLSNTKDTADSKPLFFGGKLTPSLPSVLARMVASGELGWEDAFAICPSRYEAITSGSSLDPLTEESIRIRFG